MHRIRTATFLFTLLLTAGLAARAWGHCDTLDGPVAIDVERATAEGDVAPVLKWIAADDEAEVRRVFAEAREVRQAGGAAAALADRYFLETAIRLHRESEGAPYTGVKPAGLPVEPAVAAVDGALREGSSSRLIERLQHRVAEAVGARFDAAHEAAGHAEHNVEAGRASVHAYVELVHYVEHLHALLTREAGTTEAAAAGHGH